MQRLTPPQPSAARQRQRGITLIESLVAIVVAALGILGIVGVQMRTLTDTRASLGRAQAIRLIEDLGERMQINPNTLMLLNDSSKQATLLTKFDDTPIAVNDAKLTKCSSTGACESADLAAYDIATWRRAVATQFPLGKARTFLAAGEADGSRRLLGVMVAWRENLDDKAKNDATYKDNIDVTKEKNASGNWVNIAGDEPDQVCPTGSICHLQYIPIANRCAPDPNFPNQLFCPGK